MGGRLHRSHRARDLTDLSFSLRSVFATEEAIVVLVCSLMADGFVCRWDAYLV